MTDEKWQQLVETAEQHFKNVKVAKEDLVHESLEGQIREGAEIGEKTVRGTQDILEFTHPNGDRYRLIRTNKPIVLEKKEVFSHRAGQSAQTQYKFSNTEFSHHLQVFKEVDFEWEEITLDKMGL